MSHLSLKDVSLGGPPVLAWPMDPASNTVRKESRLNKVVLLRFDQGRWLAIEASYDESGILVRMLGGGPQRRVESIAGELKEVGKPRLEKKADPALYVGDRVVEFDGEPSREIRVERIVYQGGKVLYHETWFTHYLDEAKIVRVGTKPRPEPAAPPEEEKEKEKPPAGGDGDGAARRR